MTSKNTLIIGTRGSALALAQADMVCAALSLRYPELDVRREIIHTIGDRRTDVPLADVARVSGMVDKGIFIKELETALRDGRIDVAVHSLKDVPSELAGRALKRPGRSARRRWLIWYWPMGREERKRRISSSPISR